VVDARGESKLTGETELDEPSHPVPLFPNSGPNFVPFELVEVSPGILELRPNRKFLLFVGIYTGLGAVAGAAGVLAFVLSRNPISLLGLPAGVALFTIGYRQSAISNRTRRFDSLRREVTIPAHPEKYRSPYHTFSFDQIDRLQIAEKLLNGGEDVDYACYELIIVFKTGARSLLVHHSDKAVMAREAERLSQSVGCQLQV
jgi:hypothetical protein